MSGERRTYEDYEEMGRYLEAAQFAVSKAQRKSFDMFGGLKALTEDSARPAAPRCFLQVSCRHRPLGRHEQGRARPVVQHSRGRPALSAPRRAHPRQAREGGVMDRWAERDRQRRAKKKAREDAERRLEELREAWRQRRADEEEGKKAGPWRRRTR